jgi:hypothetical protein
MRNDYRALLLAYVQYEPFHAITPGTSTEDERNKKT